MRRVSIVTVDPNLAATMLATQKANRNLRRAKVDEYANDMKNGNWSFTGESICFNKRGELVQGQHRLNAIIKSGVTLQIVVVYDVDDDAILDMDSGMKRQFSDYLQITGETNTAVVAGICARMNEYRTGNRRCTHAESRSILDEFPDIHMAAGLASSKYKSVSELLHSPAVAGFLIWATNRIDPDKMTSFFDGVKSGANLVQGHPALVLRDTVLRAFSVASKRPTHNWVLAVTIKAWNAYYDDKPIKQLKYARLDEVLPEISGLTILKPCKGGKA